MTDDVPADADDNRDQNMVLGVARRTPPDGERPRASSLSWDSPPARTDLTLPSAALAELEARVGLSSLSCHLLAHDSTPTQVLASDLPMPRPAGRIPSTSCRGARPIPRGD
jgi:hypothetical protein